MIDMSILDDLEDLKKEFESEFQDLKRELAETLLEGIKELTPVDTGYLRDSYEIEESEDGFEVVTDCEYAPFVDNGHSTNGGSFVQGKHMYDKSMLKLESKAEKKIAKFLDKVNKF